jgi:hypothetical protein
MKKVFRENLGKEAFMLGEFKPDKRYIVVLTTKFEGTFTHYEDGPDGFKYAVFNTGTVGRRNEPQTRRIRIENIVTSALTKM